MLILLCISPFPIALLMPNRKSLEIYLTIMFIMLLGFGVYAEVYDKLNQLDRFNGVSTLIFYLSLGATGSGAIIKACLLNLRDHIFIIGSCCLFTFLIVDNSFNFLEALGLVKPQLIGG